MHACSIPTAYRILSVPKEAAEKWIYLGLIPVDRDGRNRIVGIRGLVALDLVRRLRSRKVSVPTVRRLTDYLHTVTDEQLSIAIEAGRSILVSEGESLATLASLSDSVRNATGRGVLLIAIDLAVCVDHIRERIAELTESAEVTQGN